MPAQVASKSPVGLAFAQSFDGAAGWKLLQNPLLKSYETPVVFRMMVLEGCIFFTVLVTTQNGVYFFFPLQVGCHMPSVFVFFFPLQTGRYGN